MSDLLALLDDALDHDEMPGVIVEALGDEGRAGFDAFVSRVEGRFESSPNYPSFLQFLEDHSLLRDDEVVRLFEFIYSSLVNNFKGELAELLARPALREFASRFPGFDLFLGPRLVSPQLRAGRTQWAKGPDALVAKRAGRRLEIAAIAEIKAMYRTVPDMQRQIDSQLERLGRGLTVDGEELGGDAIVLREPLSRLLIRPWRKAPDGNARPHGRLPNVWLSELPYGHAELTEAAYRFTAWYFSRFGPRVFHLPGDSNPGRRRLAPHIEDSLEANGLNSFLEALYHVGLRRVFEFPDEKAPRGGRRTPGQTFLWLYNSMVQGSAQANAVDMYDPPFERDKAYEERWHRRESALEEYRNHRFDAAIESMPEPSEQTDVWARRREWLMVARIHARRRDVASAEEAFRKAQSEPQTSNRAIPLEMASVAALIAIAKGDSAEARRRINEATAMRDRLRAEIRARKDEHRGFPADIDEPTLATAEMDLELTAGLHSIPHLALMTNPHALAAELESSSDIRDRLAAALLQVFMHRRRLTLADALALTQPAGLPDSDALVVLERLARRNAANLHRFYVDLSATPPQLVPLDSVRQHLAKPAAERSPWALRIDVVWAADEADALALGATE